MYHKHLPCWVAKNTILYNTLWLQNMEKKGGARQKNKEYAEKRIDQKWHDSPMSSDHQILSASSGAGTQRDGEDKASVWVRDVLTPISNLRLTFHIFYQVPTTATQILSHPPTIPRLSKKNGTHSTHCLSFLKTPVPPRRVWSQHKDGGSSWKVQFCVQFFIQSRLSGCAACRAS